MIVDTAWLERHAYYRQLRNHYVSAGWLERLAPRVYRRPGGKLHWEQVVISMQNLLGLPLIVGGRTALELQGFAHYLSASIREVHLYGPDAAPSWLRALPLPQRFVHHNSERLFRDEPVARALAALSWRPGQDGPHARDAIHGAFKAIPWGADEWPITVSTPERAIFEWLDELPTKESFHQVDALFSGLSTLSPRRLQKLLADCRSVKVKRLFFFFADRHPHRWRNQVKPEAFDLGQGDRMLVKGGKLDRRYRITVPEDLDALS